MTAFFRNEVVTISSSGTVSTAIDLVDSSGAGYSAVGMIMPAAFTGSTVSFQASDDGTTYYAVYNTNNTLLSASVTQGRMYLFTPGDFIGVRFLKVVSGSTESTSRTIKLMTRLLT